MYNTIRQIPVFFGFQVPSLFLYLCLEKKEKESWDALWCWCFACQEREQQLPIILPSSSLTVASSPLLKSISAQDHHGGFFSSLCFTMYIGKYVHVLFFHSLKLSSCWNSLPLCLRLRSALCLWFPSLSPTESTKTLQEDKVRDVHVYFPYNILYIYFTLTSLIFICICLLSLKLISFLLLHCTMLLLCCTRL